MEKMHWTKKALNFLYNFELKKGGEITSEHVSEDEKPIVDGFISDAVRLREDYNQLGKDPRNDTHEEKIDRMLLTILWNRLRRRMSRFVEGKIRRR